MRIGDRVRVKTEWIDMEGRLRDGDIGEIIGTGESKNRDWEVKFPNLQYAVAFDSDELVCDAYSRAGISKYVRVVNTWDKTKKGLITDTHFCDPFGVPSVEVYWDGVPNGEWTTLDMVMLEDGTTSR